MSALSIQPTYPIFTDIDGQPLEDGYVWIGTANLDPQVNPINVYWDAALTLPAAQPIRTLAGYPANSGTPARLYVNSDYSIRVMNKNGSVVYSAPAATERFGNLFDALNVVYNPPFAGSVQTNVEVKLSQIASTQDFGAVGDGVTDDTAAIQSALTYCANFGKTLFFPSGTYRANSLVSDCAIDMDESAVLKYNGAENGVLLDIQATGKVFGKIIVDGNGQNVTPVKISGSTNEIESIHCTNVTATASGGSSFVGVNLFGAGNTIHSISASNFVNSGHPNGSFPQAVLAYGADNRIDSIVLRNCRTGLVCSTDVSTSVGEIVAYNMEDNGIYQLAGTLTLDSLMYFGNEEPAVFIGDAVVGSIFVRGAASGIGFQNCGDVTIGHLDVQPDASGNSVGFLFRTRDGSTSCGRITFGKITGKFTGSTLFLLNQGLVEYLSIGSASVNFLYDAVVATSLSSWANITACAGFRLTDFYVEVTDVNNVTTGASIFTMTVNPAITKHSFAHDMDVQLYLSDGVTEAAGSFRGVNFAQQLIETRGIQWRTDIGPYVVGSTLDSGIDDTANAVPTSGSWKRGKRLNQAFPASGGTEGWVCVLAGTPGTWKTFGIIS